MRTIGALVAVHKDFGLVWMTGQHQCLPECEMPEQEVFDALKYRIEVNDIGTTCYYNSVEQLHRDDGPAVVFADNTKQWYQNGQLHRPDGPAVEWADGNKFWYINGRMMTEEEFNQAVKNV